ncbi:hypothetical protein CXF86_13900 [Shewanella sp. GutCb]|uniref:hypothetical protein n=1 Tax=Shewanella sp. GutCb TaxID=2058315 RepID=UPI000C79842B|nr:hypothetical protein [Shewanella sp. GutCb]PKG74211.1 hypothetical protein CXF86_13900 [Shewanella sp. GutCb]
MATLGNNRNVTHQAWGLMCNKTSFTCKEIAQLLNVKTNKIVGLTRTLLRKNAIEVVEKRVKDKGYIYRTCIERQMLTVDQPKVRKSPRRVKASTRSQQLWNAIRIHRVFTVNLLKTTTDASESLINNYVWHLEKSGLVRRVMRTKNATGKSCVKFRLMIDLGRLYPRTQRGGMWDQNNQVFYPFKDDNHE